MKVKENEEERTSEIEKEGKKPASIHSILSLYIMNNNHLVSSTNIQQFFLLFCQHLAFFSLSLSLSFAYFCCVLIFRFFLSSLVFFSFCLPFLLACHATILVFVASYKPNTACWLLMLWFLLDCNSQYWFGCVRVLATVKKSDKKYKKIVAEIFLRFWT